MNEKKTGHPPNSLPDEVGIVHPGQARPLGADGRGGYHHRGGGAEQEPLPPPPHGDGAAWATINLSSNIDKLKEKYQIN